MRSAVVTALTVAATCPSAAVAGAGDDAHVISEQVTIDGGKTTGLAVQCPAGERALSGGATAPGVTIAVSGPLDASGETNSTETGDIPRYWYTAVNNPGEDRVPANFYAVCSASSDATIRAESFDLIAKGQAYLTGISCGTGERVIGGGLGTTGSVDAVLSMSYPQNRERLPFFQFDGDIADSWIVRIENTVAATRTYKRFAICSPTSAATIGVKYLPLTAGTSTEVAPCPSGQRVLSGGWGAEYSRPTASASAPTAAEGAASGWTATLTAAPDAAEYPTHGVFAICEGPAPPPQPTPDPTPEPDPGPASSPDPGPDSTPSATPNPLCAKTEATIVGTESSETITGTPGDDVIAGLGGDDKIRASGGNDVVCGGTGNDKLRGGGGTDLLLGEQGRDSLAGGGGRGDSCFGGRNRDSNAGSCEKGRA